MKMTEAQAAADWELCKLVHDLDMQSSARMRERLTKLGVTVAQASALRELTGPMTMSELAGRMSCEPSNATVVVDNLESHQLIERRPHPTDRRAKQLILTPAGAERRKQLLKIVRDEPLVSGLTEDELDKLRNLLERALGRA
jgi:DNA-binding MarR family transcriptional regulator